MRGAGDLLAVEEAAPLVAESTASTCDSRSAVASTSGAGPTTAGVARPGTKGTGGGKQK
jgi:hypothetical protein